MKKKDKKMVGHVAVFLYTFQLTFLQLMYSI